jgi:hypothetical protein
MRYPVPNSEQAFTNSVDAEQTGRYNPDYTEGQFD